MTHRLPVTGSPSRSTARRAFTLIELLIVVVIVGVLVAIMVPRLRVSPAMRAQLAGMQLAQDIDVTRTRALSTRQRTRVHFAQGARWYGGYLDTDGDGSIGQSAAEAQALRGFGERPLPKGVTFGRGAAPALPTIAAGGDVTFPGASIDFDSRGLLQTPGGGAVYLVSTEDPTAVVAVAVSPSGNTRLWTWKSSGGWQ